MNDLKNLNIAVAGTGYVGLSIATLLSQHHQVSAVDVIPEKVDKINNRISPIQDEYIDKYLAEKELNLTATLDGASAYRNADFVVIAAPTNYDPVKNYFDTSHVEEVIDLVLEVNPDAVMVIKSTIPVGYCRSLYVKYAKKFRSTPALAGKKFNLLFSPEFLRESKALYDNLYPSRIIVGFPKLINGRDEENAAIQTIAGEHLEEKAHEFAALLQEGALKPDIDTLFMGLKEAEAVKLFANIDCLGVGFAVCFELDVSLGLQELDHIVAAALDRLHILSGLTGNAELIVVPDQPVQPLQTPEEDPLLFPQQLVHQKRIVRSACGPVFGGQHDLAAKETVGLVVQGGQRTVSEAEEPDIELALVALNALALHVHLALGRDDGFDIVGLGQGTHIHIVIHHQQLVFQVCTAETVVLYLLDAGGIHVISQHGAHYKSDSTLSFAALTNHQEHFLPLCGRQ